MLKNDLGWRSLRRCAQILLPPPNDTDVPDFEGRDFPSMEEALAYATDLARFEFGEHAKQQGRVVLSTASTWRTSTVASSTQCTLPMW